jgi:hypothetical protein
MTIAAIMQPTYLPWLGYFAMMAEADIFVFLDGVQFEKRSWQQRNRVKGPQGAHLLTVPVLTKGVANQPIDEVLIEPGSDFRRRHIETLRHFYGRSVHFAEASALLFPLIERPIEHLAEYTVGLTGGIAAALGITTRTMRSRDLAAQGAKADLLAAICRELDAKTYVAAPGSFGYLTDSDAFRRAGIDVTYNTFRVTPYPQPYGDFVSHLSAADALFCIGTKATRDLIQAGRHVTPAAEFAAEQSVA